MSFIATLLVGIGAQFELRPLLRLVLDSTFLMWRTAARSQDSSAICTDEPPMLALLRDLRGSGPAESAKLVAAGDDRSGFGFSLQPIARVIQNNPNALFCVCFFGRGAD